MLFLRQLFRQPGGRVPGAPWLPRMTSLAPWAAAIAILFSLAPTGFAAGARKQPNIVFILADDKDYKTRPTGQSDSEPKDISQKSAIPKPPAIAANPDGFRGINYTLLQSTCLTTSRRRMRKAPHPFLKPCR
jgi:hypothetical protein